MRRKLADLAGARRMETQTFLKLPQNLATRGPVALRGPNVVRHQSIYWDSWVEPAVEGVAYVFYTPSLLRGSAGQPFSSTDGKTKLLEHEISQLLHLSMLNRVTVEGWRILTWLIKTAEQEEEEGGGGAPV